jgi:uroporphyrin-III C-methyltransferase
MTEQVSATPLPVSDSPESPEARPATPPPAPKQTAGARHNWLGALAILLVLAACVGGYLYDNWRSQQQTAELHQLELKLVELQQQQPALQESDHQRQQQLQNLSTNQQQLSDKQGQLEKQLLGLESRRPNDWLLAEADYLVRMAGRKLWLERDVMAAQMLLIEADNRLRDMNDASLLPLRQALTSDLTKLKELPLLDREGLVLRIGALIDNVDQLTLLGINPPPAAEGEEDAKLTSDPSDWQTNLKKSWTTFSENFITIRRRNGNTEALISPQQTWYLKENLKTRLLQAQLAIYREQQAVYEDNLSKASSWLEQYFDPNDSTSQYMHGEIAKLLEQPVVLDYPKQFQSQHQLEELVHQRLQHLMAQ